MQSPDLNSNPSQSMCSCGTWSHLTKLSQNKYNYSASLAALTIISFMRNDIKATYSAKLLHEIKKREAVITNEINQRVDLTKRLLKEALLRLLEKVS